MFVVLVYDGKNCSKLNSRCKKYLHWTQNSVFEGQLSASQLVELKHSLEQLLLEGDSIYLYVFKSRYYDKQVLGVEKNNSSNIL